MILDVLRDPDTSQTLCEAILKTSNGKRALSRLARTCRAISEPAIDVLWGDLDSINPIIGLFPTSLLKKAHRPGMGLVKAPRGDDWKRVLKYGEKIRRIVYDENANNVAPSIFSFLEECRPQTYILPRLRELTWRVETGAGLNRCSLFLCPVVSIVNLEINADVPHLPKFLEDMSNCTTLIGFSLSCPTGLPDTLMRMFLRQRNLEKIALIAPGALSPGIGRWLASLQFLKALQLDLTGRSDIAIEGFFEELYPHTGALRPSSVGTLDSGAYSGKGLDFSRIRKSALRLTGDLPSNGSFAHLRKLHLTGDVSNLAVFVKNLPCRLVQLDLVIEDPPDNAAWQDLSVWICECFSDSLQSLRISATNSSKFMDLVRSTSHGAQLASTRLSLECITSLPSLTRLEIDLPASTILAPSDLSCLAKACPGLEVLKLCPLARFPQHAGPPKVTLEDLAPLIKGCRRLHTLAIAFNAKQGSSKILSSRIVSSSLLRLHVGHSWISDPLQVSILLSHLAPRLESLKWFQEKNRPGVVETNAKNWQTTSEILPQLQVLRSTEKALARVPPQSITATSSRGIDATVKKAEYGVLVRPQTSSLGSQCSPLLINCGVDAAPRMHVAAVHAAPSTRDASVNVSPLKMSTGVDATALVRGTEFTFTDFTILKMCARRLRDLRVIPSILRLFSFIYHFLIFQRSGLSSRLSHLIARYNPLPHMSSEYGSSAAPSTVHNGSDCAAPQGSVDVQVNEVRP